MLFCCLLIYLLLYCFGEKKKNENEGKTNLFVLIWNEILSDF